MPDYVLKKRMAQTPERVYNLLEELKAHYLAPARREVEAVAQLAKEKEGADFELMPWDFAHYAHLLKLRDYDLDAEWCVPTWSCRKWLRAFFGLATTLYGITFKENPEIPVYHEEVKAYEVFDTDGSFLAVLYTDFFPRASKQSGAWMTAYREAGLTWQGEVCRPPRECDDELHQTHSFAPVVAHFRRVGNVPARVWTRAARHFCRYALSGTQRHQRFSGISWSSLRNSWRILRSVPNSFVLLPIITKPVARCPTNSWSGSRRATQL